MKNVLWLIPRMHQVRSVPMVDKARSVTDAAYNAVADVCSNGYSVKSLVCTFDESSEQHVVYIRCNTYAFHAFVERFQTRVLKKYVWRILKAK